MKDWNLSAFKRAVWVFHTNVGVCNGCDIEVIDVLTPYYETVANPPLDIFGGEYNVMEMQNSRWRRHLIRQLQYPKRC